VGGSVEEDIVRVATEVAAEPPDPGAPLHRDLRPYATYRRGLNRPYTKAFLIALRGTVTGKWEARRVARVVAAADGRRWSLTDAEAILRREPIPEDMKEIALDLLIHAYLDSMA
jgi:hypothetical protein